MSELWVLRYGGEPVRWVEPSETLHLSEMPLQKAMGFTSFHPSYALKIDLDPKLNGSKTHKD
jgi:hypothetical protein